MRSSWPRRRVITVGVACAAPALLAVVWLFASGKTFVASGTVRVEPVWVAALAPGGPLTGTPEEAHREQARAAREDLDRRLDAIEPDFSYTVTPDGRDAFRFDVRAGAPEDALEAADAVLSAFAASRNDSGAVQQAIDQVTVELAEVDAQLATPEGAADPALTQRRAVLQQQLTTYQEDAAVVAAAPAAVVDAPERPTEPASPPFGPILRPPSSGGDSSGSSSRGERGPPPPPAGPLTSNPRPRASAAGEDPSSAPS